MKAATELCRANPLLRRRASRSPARAISTNSTVRCRTRPTRGGSLPESSNRLTDRPTKKKYIIWTEEQIRQEMLENPAPADVEVGLRVSDAYAANEAIEIQVRRTEGLESDLRVIVETDAAKQSAAQSITAARPGEWYSAKLGALPTGSYRVRVLAHPRPSGFPSLGGTVSDVFLVM